MIKARLRRQCLGWFSGMLFLLLSGCGGGGGTPPSSSQSPLGPLSAACLTAKGTGNSSGNSLPLYLGTAGDNDQSVCGAAINNPCTDITICSPSGSGCQTISNILVDTGSSGIRIFRSLLSNTSLLPGVETSSGNPAGECAAFGNGSYGDWGPLVYAQVRMSGEPPVIVPIQLIDPTYAGQYDASGSPESAACGTTFSPDTSPSQATFNGILGVGLFVHFCGNDCVPQTNGTYFSCSGSTCTPSTLSTCSQDQNPVAQLPTDNQGVLLSFSPQITNNEQSATGSLYLGINTQTDNTASATAYEADSSGNFITQFNGTTYSTANGTQAFIDSGSDGYFFQDSQIPNSGSPDYYYTQSATPSATIQGVSGDTSITVSFTISNPPATGSGFTDGIIPDIGFSASGVFDWGMPFFFLKQNVFVGINRKTSSLGTGPYWAF